MNFEVIASEDMWIWHCYFGLPISHNDINILQRSYLFAWLAASTSPPCNFTVNGHQYDQSYYLADAIYPSWSTFIKTKSKPKRRRHTHFAKVQEAQRKDIDRALGVCNQGLQLS